MAKNTGMKRTVYRYIRDGVKSNYTYKSGCEVCGTSEDLELHHPHTVSLLFDEFCKQRGITYESVDDIMEIRQEFYKQHWTELVEDVMTLCNTHHKALHKVYGNQPPLATAEKQKHWVLRRSQAATPTAEKPVIDGTFASLMTEPFTNWSRYGISR